MAEVSVTRELQPTHGRYVGRVEGFAGEAELTFERVSPTLVIADHTLTPVSLRGRGIASMLVERLVADARAEGFKIRPTCPYIAAQFDRHPDWSDLRA
jgi:predicted GNAT family acetyltransferase